MTDYQRISIHQRVVREYGPLVAKNRYYLLVAQSLSRMTLIDTRKI